MSSGDNYAIDYYPSSRTFGQYEDLFRGEQYGIPMSVGCLNPNPYIQDDKMKDQRFYPIRTVDVQDRAAEMGNNECNKELHNYLYGKKCDVAMKQKTYYIDEAGDCLADRLRRQQGLPVSVVSSEASAEVLKEAADLADAKKAEEKSKGKILGLDAKTILMLFVFVLLVYLCIKLVMASQSAKKQYIDESGNLVMREDEELQK